MATTRRDPLVQTGFCIGGQHDDCPGFGLGGLAGPCGCDCHGSDECDECNGSGRFFIDGEARPCVCAEAEPGSGRERLAGRGGLRMGWATRHIEALRRGESVEFRPRGRSMESRIHDGALVRVEPIGGRPVEADEVVLCRVGGAEYLHLVLAVDGERCLIGNNKGGTNGWTKQVFGRVVSVAA